MRNCAQVATFVWCDAAYEAALERRKGAGRISTQASGYHGEDQMRIVFNNEKVSQDFIKGMKSSSADPAWCVQESEL